jgi:hypothetical protein
MREAIKETGRRNSDFESREFLFGFDVKRMEFDLSWPFPSGGGIVLDEIHSRGCMKRTSG